MRLPTWGFPAWRGRSGGSNDLDVEIADDDARRRRIERGVDGRMRLAGTRLKVHGIQGRFS